MRVGCYDLGVYCDSGDDCVEERNSMRGMVPTKFVGASYVEAAANAKKAGWTHVRPSVVVLKADGSDLQDFCPGCSKKRKKSKSTEKPSAVVKKKKR